MQIAKLFLVTFFSIAVASCGGGGASGGNAPATITISATATSTSQNLAVGTAMASFLPLTASGGATPYTYSITTGTLPAGLSLNASTGAVTGTPTAAYITANIVFSVHDANNTGAGTTSTVSFTVLPAGYVVQGGLTWMPATFSDTWTNANSYCSLGTINGQTGWRLPTQAELLALYASGAMIGKGWTVSDTWSSTPAPYNNYYGVNLTDGSSWYGSAYVFYVTCVR